MPIIGLTDRASLTPRFPRLGKLRKGEKKQNGKIGRDLEYFRFTSDQPDVVDAFVAAYGKQPQRLEVYLPYKEPDQVFETWLEEWSAGGLVHRCDGQTCTIWRKDDGSYGYAPRPCPYESGAAERTKQQPGCIITGRLSVILPDLLKAGYVGYVVLETHSNHDVRNIMATLLAVEEARPQGLQGIPFALRRYKEAISTPAGDNGGRVRRDKWLVELSPAPTWVESRIALARSEAFAALPEGDPLVIEADEAYSADNGDHDEDGAGFSDNGHDDPEIVRDLEWARTLTADSGKTFGELAADQLTWIIEHKKPDADVYVAASLLLDNLQATISEPVQDEEPDTEARDTDEALDTFAEMVNGDQQELFG